MPGRGRARHCNAELITKMISGRERREGNEGEAVEGKSKGKTLPMTFQPGKSLAMFSH